MSAAKHPYDVRDERGRFVRATAKTRASLERMRGWIDPERERLANSANVRAGFVTREELAQLGYCEAIYRPARRSILQRIREYFMWHPR